MTPGSGWKVLPESRRSHTVLARVAALTAGLVLPLVAVTAATPTNAGAASVPAASVPAAKTAYWLVASDGGLFGFGGAPFYGSMGGRHLNEPIVGMAGAPTSTGYWEVASDGGIFTFGSAQFYGSMGGHPLNQPVVGMAATSTGAGYWEVASDGGIFCFGDDQFHGSMGGHPLNQPIVGMAAMPTGGGYWEVARDGGIFAFGSAQFHGSMGGHPLNQPIAGMAAMPTGGGYWEVARDGGMFTFGDAGYHGSLGGRPQSRPVVGMAGMFSGGGYWLTDDNGLVDNFGTATYWGSAPQVLNDPVVGIATAVGDGDPSNGAYQSGSYGYDVSVYQCTNLPPPPHQVGVVEVDGSSGGATNPCLATEARWSGGGLNLYTFLTYGTTPTSPDTACATTHTPAGCNFGYNTAVAAFGSAQAAGIDALVPWWLDIEPTGHWSSNVTDNAAMVRGAMDALHFFEGVNSVGFYFSATLWQTLMGSFNPSGPLWVASWGMTPGDTCTSGRAKSAAAGHPWPSGPVELVQYSNNVGGYDGDYAC
ncbi:MAG: hypothetical protein ACRDY3_12500 [Acidimicrobiales bacterium]